MHNAFNSNSNRRMLSPQIKQMCLLFCVVLVRQHHSARSRYVCAYPVHKCLSVLREWMYQPLLYSWTLISCLTHCSRFHATF